MTSRDFRTQTCTKCNPPSAGSSTRNPKSLCTLHQLVIQSTSGPRTGSQQEIQLGGGKEVNTYFQTKLVTPSIGGPRTCSQQAGLDGDGKSLPATVHRDCKVKFLELKAKKTHRFIIFKIDEEVKQVMVEKLGKPATNYGNFTARLPTNECRYAVYDHDFATSENRQERKIVFIAWSPDTAGGRSKMLYASLKESFKSELDGIQVELQATNPTEMGLDVIRGRAN